MNDFEFQFFPNPVQDWLKVVLADADKAFLLEISDAQGKKVLQKRLASSVSNISVSALNAGYYEIRISADGISSTQQFVIQR